jgi:hypothetical protein
MAAVGGGDETKPNSGSGLGAAPLKQRDAHLAGGTAPAWTQAGDALQVLSKPAAARLWLLGCRSCFSALHNQASAEEDSHPLAQVIGRQEGSRIAALMRCTSLSPA